MTLYFIKVVPQHFLFDKPLSQNQKS